jgi:predicted secreted hydrolase
MKNFFLTGLCSSICLIFIVTPLLHGQEYRDVFPGYSVQLPDDLFYKDDYRVQWWYFTGHLFDESGREFGYELTFFVVGVQKRIYKSQFGTNRIYISHFAISDVGEEGYFFHDRTDSGAFSFAGADDKRLRVWVGKDMLEGTTDRMHIEASEKDTSIDLEIVPEKPVILHGQKGYSRKSEESPLISSIYLSYTSLKTEGRLKIGDQVFSVKGKSWFDREISSRGLGDDQAGWDWFSIQLDDGREIMLYILRNKDGSLDNFSSGTVVYRDGRYRHLAKDDFTVAVLHHYISEKTGARYPSKWKVDIPPERIVLRITPLIQDQEFIAHASTGNYYWEGTCKVEGSAQGRAYVEMTGY